MIWSWWLEQGGSVLDGNGYGIESINFANYTYNTNTNVYSHFFVCYYWKKYN